MGKDAGRAEAHSVAALYGRNIDFFPVYSGLMKAGADAVPLPADLTRLRAAAQSKTTLTFDSTNPRAVAYAKEKAGKLVTSLTKDNRAALNKIISQSIQDQLPPTTAAKLVQSVIGLTDDQADAVSNAYGKLVVSPGKTVQVGSKAVRVPVSPSQSFFDNEVEAYSNRLLASRAETIARTETLDAINEGQEQLWGQAVAAGYLDEGAQKVWIANDTACPLCLDLDGVAVPLDEEFDDGVDGPPLHPNCECTLGLEP
jgi:acyl-CoA synthetase (AMP-forming)/AMP-acid ligase II